jgi:hypothetical protein
MNNYSVKYNVMFAVLFVGEMTCFYSECINWRSAEL